MHVKGCCNAGVIVESCSRCQSKLQHVSTLKQRGRWVGKNGRLHLPHNACASLTSCVLAEKTRRMLQLSCTCTCALHMHHSPGCVFACRPAAECSIDVGTGNAALRIHQQQHKHGVQQLADKGQHGVRTLLRGMVSTRKVMVRHNKLPSADCPGQTAPGTPQVCIGVTARLSSITCRTVHGMASSCSPTLVSIAGILLAGRLLVAVYVVCYSPP